MSIEKLTGTIIESAQKKAKEISDKYEEDIKKLKDTTDEKMIKLAQENNEQLAQQKTLIETQLVSNAQLKTQQQLLNAKWQMIDDIFKKAQEKFIASDKYINSLKEIITKNADNESELIVSEKDLDKLQKQIPNAKLLSNDNLAGGLIIRKGRVELNYSIDRIIKSLKSELIIELSKLFFEK